MKTKFLSLLLILVLCLTAFPLCGFAATPSSSGAIVLSGDGTHYTYTLPETAPAHNYYSEAFSTSHEFRDIFISQFGSDKAFVYDLLAHVMIEVLYDDSLEYAKDIVVTGFERIADVKTMSAAHLAVQKDMPFLSTFVFYCGGGSGYNYDTVFTRQVINYFSDDAPTDNRSYIATRHAVIAELNDYRAAVAGVTDDEEKLEIAGSMFTSGGVYDLNAPYHALQPLLYKSGKCGSCNWAFTLVGNAVGVPAYFLSVSDANHAVTLVRPNGGELKVIDVTFGNRSQRVRNVSEWGYRNKMTWNNDSLNFKNEFYFPDVDILEHLGGLS